MNTKLTKSLMRATLFVIITLLHAKSFSFDAGLSGYTISAGPWKSEYRLMSLFVLPNQKLDIRVEYQGKNIAFNMLTDSETKPASDSKASIRYQWQAPASPGSHRLKIIPDIKEQDLIASELLVFVMHPASEVIKGKLNGYSIGEYPKQPLKGLAIYQPPTGFVEVTKDNKDLWVSPHYQLKQFLCKQNQGFPKYVVLQTRLLRKLEFFTQAVNEHGIATNGFTIMSGYRTPFYNTAIGNKTYSRHQWGGAADIYIDENPRDGVMDDLNKDGKINVEDARVLWSIVESYYSKESYKPMIGGLGIYRANAAHGPFIHIDVRGTRARW